MPEPWIDQILLVLEMIGILIIRVPTFINEFKPNLLLHLISPKVPMEVVELALWLLQHSILRTENESSNHLKYLVDLLENNELSKALKERVCYGITELMYYSEKSSSIKQNFRDLGGLISLLDLLRTERDPSLCYAALSAFGEAITNCEGNKAYINDKVGFGELAKLIQSSIITLDTTLFEIFFEMATKGSVRYALDDTLNSPVTHSSTVSSIIMDILSPQALYTSDKPCFRTPRRGFGSNLQIVQFPSTKLSQEDDLSNSSLYDDDSSSEESMIINLEENNSPENNKLLSSVVNPKMWYRSLRLRKSDSYPIEDNSNGIDITDTDFGCEQTISFTESDKLRPQLVGLKVRNTDAIFMLIDLLPRSDVDTQIEIVGLLMSLLESNPETLAMLFSSEKFKDIIHIAKEAPCKARHEYFHLIALLASYSIEKSDAINLLEYAKNAINNNNNNINNTSDNNDLQLEYLYVINRISQRVHPLDYVHLGRDKGMIKIGIVDRFPSAKEGYTFCCWIKIELFSSNEVGLLSWLDLSGNTIFDLYFKKFRLQDNTEKYCLAVKTQNIPMPSQDFSFDEYGFNETSRWHHVAFTHVKQTVSVFIDGSLVQKSFSLNYPRTVSKDKAMLGKIGYRKNIENNHESYFCGSFSSLHFYTGALSESIINSLYIYKNSADSILSKIESKEFLTIEPKLLLPSSSPSSSSLLLNQSSSSDNLSSSENLNIDNNIIIDEDLLCNSPDTSSKQLYIKSSNHYYEGDVSIHCTKSFKDWSLDINALHYCLEFMGCGPEQQIASLSIISLLLQKSILHRNRFKELNGYNILHYLLQKFDNAIEIFDILLDILCDGAITYQKYIFIDEECAILIFDLLLYAKDSHKRILSHVDQMLLRCSSNIEFLVKNVGFLPLFEVQESLSNTNGTSLFHILARMFRTKLDIYQIEQILNYIIANSDIEENNEEDKKVKIERTTKILHHFQVAMATSIYLIDYLKEFLIVFSLIKSPHESIRLIAINMIGILLDSCFGKLTNFTKIMGYQRLIEILIQFPITAAICAQLLDCAIGTFQFLAGNNISGKSKKSLSPRCSWNISFGTKRLDLQSRNRSLVYPELIYVLFSLLKESNNPVAKIQTLSHIEILLDQNENKETLWKHPWLEWCSLFMTNQPHDPDTRSLLEKIIQKMMLYEFGLSKSTRYLKLKEMIDNEPFQIHILEILIEYFDEKPALSTSNSSEIIKSLSLLYKNMEYIKGAGIGKLKLLLNIIV